MRRTWKAGLLLIAASLFLLTGCGAEKTNASTEEQESSEIQEKSAAEKEAEEMLRRSVAALESQFPGQKFEEMDKREMEEATEFFKNSYVFAGRKAENGFSYILGILKTEDNPLEGLTCGQEERGAGYSVSQFDDGHILLLEKGDTMSGLSWLYDSLEDGMDGIAYLEDAAKRGAVLIPPENGEFQRKFVVRDGRLRTEYMENEGANLSGDILGKLSEITSASLSGIFENGIRTETLNNREDLETLKELLQRAEPTEFPMNQSFPGSLILTLSSGEEIELWLSDSRTDGTFPELAVGDSGFAVLDQETADAIWRLFGNVDGFRRYGDKIWMEAAKTVFSTEEAELTFILHNNSGETIQYILSPVIEKKTEENGREVWKQVESIAGFCGFLTELSEEQKEVTIPWKGSFFPDGEGVYRLGIQVLPEPELRFGVQAEFELKEEGQAEVSGREETRNE